MKHLMTWLDEAFEERAGILEFCAGMTRHDAEQSAKLECEELAKRRKVIDEDKAAQQ